MQLSLCPGQVRVSLSGSSLCPDRHSSGPITISIIKFLSALRYEEAPFIRPRQQAFAINIAFYDFAPSHMSNQRQSLRSAAPAAAARNAFIERMPAPHQTIFQRIMRTPIEIAPLESTPSLARFSTIIIIIIFGSRFRRKYFLCVILPLRGIARHTARQEVCFRCRRSRLIFCRVQSNGSFWKTGKDRRSLKLNSLTV
ncbi:hypothetical protein AVEN_66653-1 [Araneus ventricosus]|uniref:Uncharacterized protein n=1 Tax=Araneus ventricosus TaxID=182803 RepID=A0A4Y2M8S5_ARAVE|nr:hypothetical protein AVEN_66653-1 [Araneus ventricosus]